MRCKTIKFFNTTAKVGFPDISEIKFYKPKKPIKSIFTLKPISEILTIYQYQELKNENNI